MTQTTKTSAVAAGAIRTPKARDAKALMLLAKRVRHTMEVLKGVCAAQETLQEGGDVFPKLATVGSDLERTRERCSDLHHTLRQESATLAWKIIGDMTGLAIGDRVRLQYRMLTGGLDDPLTALGEERMEIKSLLMSGHDVEDFRMSLHGFRLLKNGKPGKTEVTVNLYPGLEFEKL